MTLFMEYEKDFSLKELQKKFPMSKYASAIKGSFILKIYTHFRYADKFGGCHIKDSTVTEKGILLY